MPGNCAANQLVVTPVGPGQQGAHTVMRALQQVAEGRGSAVLLPQYATAAVQQTLQELAGTAHEPAQPSICVPTSGSTGNSRSVIMPWETLALQAALRDADLGGPAAWFLALPPATAGGVVALSRCLNAGTPFAVWPGVGGSQRFTADGFIESARKLVAQATSTGVPARVSIVSRQLAQILEHCDGHEVLASFATVLIGGGPLAPRLRATALAAGVSLVHSYGLTETCGGCVYDGRPMAGTEVRIAPDGEILVAGSTLAAGYLDGPLPMQDGWLRTGDRGTWDGARLQVTGRLDEIVVVRGANVDVAGVAAVVAEVPGVLESAVVAVADPAGGHLLEAYIVGTADPQQVRAYVAAALGSAAVPAVSVVPRLPSNPGGKVDLERLRKDAL